MSISIIFPIEVGDNGAPVTNTSTTQVVSFARLQSIGGRFGVQSFNDRSPVEAIKQNLKMLLLTRPGEYVMDANYGVGLPDYLFMQEQEINTGGLESLIRSQAAEYMPYMTISDMRINIDSTMPVLNIRIEFFYNELTIPEVFELEVL